VPDLLSYFTRPGGGVGAISPVLKRRGGELVIAVQTAVESVASAGLSRSRGILIDELVTKDIEQLPSTNEAEPTGVTPTSGESRLWSFAASSSFGATSRSILFGTKSSPPTAVMSTAGTRTYATARSSLLGNASQVCYISKLFFSISPDYLFIDTLYIFNHIKPSTSTPLQPTRPAVYI